MIVGIDFARFDRSIALSLLAGVPLSDVSAQRLLQPMSARLDAGLAEAGERRIVAISADELT